MFSIFLLCIRQVLLHLRRIKFSKRKGTTQVDTTTGLPPEKWLFPKSSSRKRSNRMELTKLEEK